MIFDGRRIRSGLRALGTRARPAMVVPVSLGLVPVAFGVGLALQGVDRVEEFDRLRQRFDALEIGEDDRSEVGRQALEAFLRIRLDDPGRRERLLPAAQIARRSGRPEFGLGLAEEAFAGGVVEAPVAREILQGLLELGRASDALERAFDLRSTYPETVRRFVLDARFVDRGALFEAAGSALRRGESELGTFAFEAAATSGDALDLANLALTHRARGRFSDAIVLYEQAVAARADDAILWSDYGLCLRAAGLTEPAIGAFRRSIEVEEGPGLGPATTNLLLMHRLRLPGLEGLNGAEKEPESLVERVLGPRPQQEIVRRLQLDLALGRF